MKKWRGLLVLALSLVLSSFGAVSRKEYGAASAIWNIGFDAGTAVGSVLVGTIAAGLSFSPALLVAAAICLATLPLAFVRGSEHGRVAR